MNQVDKYYKILGLEPGGSIDDIKKAYRRCARKYHPDLNKSDNASELFILSTEAYQFLLARHERPYSVQSKEDEFINEWESYRKEQARRKAHAHARTRYNNFINSDLYKSTRVLDKSRFYIAICFALLIIILSINGYIYRMKMVDQGFKKPSLTGFLLLLSLGLLFLATPVVFLYYKYWKNRK
ncbi:MAG TPA: hypothetical protein DEQ09_07885 [Bacteroidales bacterium]|nr:hypothetical protein [Bacteroidales bacterium]